jgi:hypothetical protein
MNEESQEVLPVSPFWFFLCHNKKNRVKTSSAVREMAMGLVDKKTIMLHSVQVLKNEFIRHIIVTYD